eukprot:12936748-Prorocentrum_lima.AAC.1
MAVAADTRIHQGGEDHRQGSAGRLATRRPTARRSRRKWPTSRWSSRRRSPTRRPAPGPPGGDR